MKRSGKSYTFPTGVTEGPVTDEMIAAADALDAAADLIRAGANKNDGGQQAKAGPGAGNDRRNLAPARN
jgi:hypothetical protein